MMMIMTTNAATKQLGEVIRADLDADDLDYQHGDPDPVETRSKTTSSSVRRIASLATVSKSMRREPKTVRSSPTAATSRSISRAATMILIPLPQGDQLWQFDPGDFDVDNGAVVRFYGCVIQNDSCIADDHDREPERLSEG